MSNLKVLTRYKAWADALFLSTVSTIPKAEIIAPRAIVFGSLIRTLNHSYVIDFVWQHHLLGKPHGLSTRNPKHYPEIFELIESQRIIDVWYVNYADSITENELGEILEFEFIGGGTGRMSRRDILFHIINHATYHRGHAADILYNLNISPPTTDLPVFLRQL